MCLSALPMLAPSASAAPAAGEGRGYICITFDDAYESDYTVAYAALSKYDIPATSFVVTDRIGDDGWLTAEQIQEMYAAGWEIGSHGRDHTRLTDLPEAEVIAQMEDSKAALEGIGIDVATIAWPNGAYNSTVLDLMGDIYEISRGISTGDHCFYTHLSPDMRAIEAANPSTFDWFKLAVDGAITTDSAVVVFWHEIDEDGTIIDSLTGEPFTIMDVAEYISEKMDTHGLQPIRFRDLPTVLSDEVRTWIADEPGVASDPTNWDGGIAPSDGDYIVIKGKGDITFDADITYEGIYAFPDPDRTRRLIIGEGVTLGIGRGGVENNNKVVGMPGSQIICDGHWSGYRSSYLLNMETVNLHVTRAGAIVTGNYFDTLRLSEDVVLVGSANVKNAVIDEGVHVYLQSHKTFSSQLALNPFDADCISNLGVIDGDERSSLRLMLTSDQPLGSTIGDVRCTLNVHSTVAHDYTLTLGRNLDIAGLIVSTTSVTHGPNLDLNGHQVRAASVGIAANTAIRNGTILTSSWDSSAGGLLANTNVVLADGGSAVLAPGQSFNRLEVASEDGRTVSWTMTATGTVAPIVTGLKSGSYLWYLDGVEQGEVEAGKDGTIALSYQSTGLHELSVGPAPMTEAMDSLYGVIPIVIGLAVIGGLFTMLGKVNLLLPGRRKP
jgi:peptidoglycan/xylan/chitin deacetylase (PgdA/CDA1 family)